MNSKSNTNTLNIINDINNLNDKWKTYHAYKINHDVLYNKKKNDHSNT